MYKKDPDLKLAAVDHYLRNDTTLMATAKRFGIHYQTLVNWLRRYRKHDNKKAGLLPVYVQPWNRVGRELEDRVVGMKEVDPTLTVRQARQRLLDQGVELSVKGIWNVWKRFGHAGFVKKRLGPNYTEYCSWTDESRKKFDLAQELFKHGKVKSCARILNTIPMLPKNDLIARIPDSALNINRRVEKVAAQYKRIPIKKYFAAIKKLFRECTAAGKTSLALRLKIFEICALSYTGRPALLLENTEELKSLLGPKGGYYSSLLFTLRFTAFLSEGIARAQLGDIASAVKITRTCYDLIRRRKHPPLSLVNELGALCTWIQDFKKAEYCFSRTLESTVDDQQLILRRNLNFVLFHKGELKKSLQFLKQVTGQGWGYDARILLCEAVWALVDGRPEDALALCTRSLLQFKKEELNIGILQSYLVIAGIHSSLGDRAKAIAFLKRFLPLAAESFKNQADIFRRIIEPETGRPAEAAREKDSLLPTAWLVGLLKQGRYAKAYAFARKKSLMSDFYQFVMFFPAAVKDQIDRGKPVHLPRSILRLPLFNKERPVCYLRLLGPLVVLRNGQNLRLKMPPRETAFAVHCALRAANPGKAIPARDLFENFWPQSERPARNLSHVLVSVKRRLKIAGHQIVVTRQDFAVNLVNRGVHFMTDYDEFKQLVATARALERAGKWPLACKEYKRAFALFRGEPLGKMYDNWSLDMRRVIAEDLKSAFEQFAAVCRQNACPHVSDAVFRRLSSVVTKSFLPGAAIEANP